MVLVPGLWVHVDVAGACGGVWYNGRCSGGGTVPVVRGGSDTWIGSWGGAVVVFLGRVVMMVLVVVPNAMRLGACKGRRGRKVRFSEFSLSIVVVVVVAVEWIFFISIWNDESFGNPIIGLDDNGRMDVGMVGCVMVAILRVLFWCC